MPLHGEGWLTPLRLQEQCFKLLSGNYTILAAVCYYDCASCPSEKPQADRLENYGRFLVGR